MNALNQLAAAYEEARSDPEFQTRLNDYLKHYVGRPSPLFHAERLTKFAGGAEIYLKREDLNHTGAHKINNAIGQVMLAQRMNKNRVIAETGAGQHGVATATACALFGLECTVYMGEEDIRRQKLNVFNMKTLGATVVPVDDRLAHLARRDQRSDARLDGLVAHHALHDRQRRRPAPVSDDRPRFSVGDRPGDEGPVPRPDRPASRHGGRLRRRRLERGRDLRPVHRRRRGRVGRRRGRRPRPARPASTPPASPKASPASSTAASATSCRTRTARRSNVHSISAGLDYPGVGPEHSYWKEIGRARYESITDAEALDAYNVTARHEGILPALESSHALAQAFKEAAPPRARQDPGRLPLRPRRQGCIRGGPAAR